MNPFFNAFQAPLAMAAPPRMDASQFLGLFNGLAGQMGAPQPYAGAWAGAPAQAGVGTAPMDYRTWFEQARAGPAMPGTPGDPGMPTQPGTPPLFAPSLFSGAFVPGNVVRQ